MPGADYVVKRGKSVNIKGEKLFELYCSLKHGMRYDAFCMKYNTNALNVDDRRFITFGLIRGYVKRVHEFPVLLRKATRNPGPTAGLRRGGSLLCRR